MSNERVKAVVVFLDEFDALVSSSIVAAMLAAILDKMGVSSIRTKVVTAGNEWY